MRHVWCRRDEYRVLVGKPEAKDHLEGLGIAGNMILKWILREQDWRVRTGFR
jgi:hypothetical protein